MLPDYEPPQSESVIDGWVKDISCSKYSLFLKGIWVIFMCADYRVKYAIAYIQHK